MQERSRADRANVELITIYEVSKLLGSSLDLRQTLMEVMRLLSSHLDMRRGSVCLLDAEGTLRILAAYGMALDEIEKGQFKSGEGIVGTILKAGSPMVVPNLAEEPLFLNRTESRPDVADMVISMVGVPVKAAGETIGVITVDRVSDEGPTEGFDTDVRFLTMVANLIGQTVRLHNVVAQERQHLMAERFRLQKEVRADYRVDSVVGSSRKMQDVLAQVQRVAPFRSTVLIRGESGTGKELVARAIHNLSPRKDQPFIRINCAALPETLLESELFGYEKGAFTGASRDHKGRFELANGGTLFLDEIGDISASFQAKLLRVLQEQEFERVGGSRTIKTDVRVIAATNVNLEEAVAQGRFRADLYYRINVVSIFLPPLRERREDVVPLALHFVEKFGRENSMAMKIEDDALEVLKRCPWPGNVRELENCIERTGTLCRDGVIRPQDLSCHVGLCYSSTLWQYRTATANTAGIPAGVGMPGGGTNTGRHCSGNGCPPAGNGGSAVAPFQPPSPPPLTAPPPRDEDDADAVDDLFAAQPPGEGEPVFADPRDRLVWAMDRAGWVQAKAARLLGLTTRQVSYALRKYNIEIKKI
jgi:Nif-specific regulatory protein